jgi:hypothetical protein
MILPDPRRFFAVHRRLRTKNLHSVRFDIGAQPQFLQCHSSLFNSLRRNSTFGVDLYTQSQLQPLRAREPGEHLGVKIHPLLSWYFPGPLQSPRRSLGARSWRLLRPLLDHVERRFACGGRVALQNRVLASGSDRKSQMTIRRLPGTWRVCETSVAGSDASANMKTPGLVLWTRYTYRGLRGCSMTR